MDEYKKEFILFLLRTGALKIFENPSDDRTLKSKRISPWFVNIGDFDDGKTSAALGGFYADAISNSGLEFDLLYGIPDKGREIVVATTNEMARKGRNVPRFSTRRVPKDHGEASSVDYGGARTIREFIQASQHLSQSDRIKSWVIGRSPKNGDRLVQLDDVFTAGDAKYEALNMLNFLGEFSFPLLTIGVDRQEVGIDGKGAIEGYERKTGTKVISIATALEIYDFLKSEPTLRSGQKLKINGLERLTNYIRVYGTDAAREGIIERCGKLEQKIIERDRSVIPACDVETLEQFEELVKQTADVEGIGGYKIGFELGLGFGLPAVVEAVRKHTDKPIIYDHQKAGTDIPDTGKNYARLMKKVGVDAVILFPQSGPETERAWIYHALDQGLKVIVGGRMTHPAYAVSEGGFITDEGALDMYRIAARAGINNFVVPGNKPEVIKQVRDVVEAEGVSPVFYAAGFIAQGGNISDATKVAGNRFHGIVGRGIYQAKDMHAAAIEHTSQL
ncbi:MAG: orotidine 5'-phosphate decarboxylase [Candidatus Levybacteria bacterium]|nr:orotidine 5'-phosphate decarboxylase [Candidatus Levybacteria bacterium]